MAPSIKKNQASSGLDRYLELIKKFPLRRLHSAEELAQAIAIIDSLIVRGNLDSGEQDYLDVLADLVEKYEDDEPPMPPVSEAEMLRHLIEARGITQTKLAQDIGIPDSTISEVLASKREFTRAQVGRVAKYFSVSPLVFKI
jgi:HTH-type transcriptional regulator/antitoxin HigA